jgi:hypothetical protein
MTRMLLWKIYVSWFHPTIQFNQSGLAVNSNQIRGKCAFLQKQVISYSNNTHRYMSGGAGYVLSKEALRRFVQLALTLNDASKCRPEHNGPADWHLGMLVFIYYFNFILTCFNIRCLQSVGVQAIDSRDTLGRHRMFPIHIDEHLNPSVTANPTFWLTQYLHFSIEQVRSILI